MFWRSPQESSSYQNESVTPYLIKGWMNQLVQSYLFFKHVPPVFCQTKIHTVASKSFCRDAGAKQRNSPREKWHATSFNPLIAQEPRNLIRKQQTNLAQNKSGYISSGESSENLWPKNWPKPESQVDCHRSPVLRIIRRVHPTRIRNKVLQKGYDWAWSRFRSNRWVVQSQNAAMSQLSSPNKINSINSCTPLRHRKFATKIFICWVDIRMLMISIPEKLDLTCFFQFWFFLGSSLSVCFKSPVNI